MKAGTDAIESRDLDDAAIASASRSDCSAPLASLAADGPGLVDAARNGDLGAVRSLLKGGADPNQAAPDGSTAVHWAVHRDNLDMLERAARRRRQARSRHTLQDRAADAGRAEWQRGARRAAAGRWRQPRHGVRGRTDGAHDRGAQRQRRCRARAAAARRAGRPGRILPRADGADVRRGRRQHGRRRAAARIRREAERALQGRLHAAALRRAQQPLRDRQVPVGAGRQRQRPDTRRHVGAQHGDPERRFRPGRAAAGGRRRSERARSARPSPARGRLAAPAWRTAGFRDERRRSAAGPAAPRQAVAPRHGQAAAGERRRSERRDHLGRAPLRQRRRGAQPGQPEHRAALPVLRGRHAVLPGGAQRRRTDDARAGRRRAPTPRSPPASASRR